MIDYILMGVMAAMVLLMLILRTNTAICFFALCAGSILLSSSGDNMSLIASSLTSGVSGSSNFVRIALLLAPLVVCIFLLRKQVPKGLMPMAIIPAICTAALTILLVTPLLAEDLQAKIAVTETWEVLMQYKEPLVGIGLVVSVVLIALTVRRPHDKHKKGKHH